MTNEKVD